MKAREMKLNYFSTSLVTFLYINIILIQMIILPYLVSTTETSDRDHHEPHEDINYYQISEENKKILNDQFKAHLLKVLGLKEVPKKPTTKAFVPQAILEEYRKLRDEVRESIPEDRDFYGKIDLDDLDQTNEDFWSYVYNKFGSYDITVDMGKRMSHYNDESTESRRLYIKGEYTQASSIPTQDEPEDVPQDIERQLPPHFSGPKKQSISVHLKFNLSREFFTNNPTADELKKAELHLAREKIFDDFEGNNSDRKPVPFFSREKNNDRPTDDDKKQKVPTTSRTPPAQDISIISDNKQTDHMNAEPPDKNVPSSKPKYVRVYILHVNNYDKDNHPISSIISTQLVDTTQVTPLVFDIHESVKIWIDQPEKNYGLIVRVVNENEEQSTSKEKRAITSPNLKNVTTTNDSTSSVIYPNLLEHVRLKRAFHFYSESDEVWDRKKPRIIIFYGLTEDSSRRHVKRDHQSANGGHTVISDDESQHIKESNQNNTSQTTFGNNNFNDAQSTPLVQLTPATSGKQSSRSTQNINPLTNKRESRQTVSSNQHNRNAGRSSTTTHQSQKKNRAKANKNSEKCSMRTLSVNFDDVGWSSWIIAPTAYLANYCAGDCSFPATDHQNATNHAIIQSIFHSVGRIIPRPCCAPTKLGKMALLYQLDGSVQMRHYDDMIVESCGCS